MKKNLILLIIFLTSFLSISQDLPTVIQPSPTAASLGQFGDIPVGYYTGTPNVQIPLYEIKSGSLTLPITVSYQSTGLRVAQDASWVGLGWSLSAGGLITRVIRGNDDFHSSGFNHCDNLPEPDNLNQYNPLAQSSDPDSDLFYWRQLNQGVIDGEPDLFSYNFGDYTGTFIIDKSINGSGTFSMKQNNLKIEGDYYFGTSKFIITTPDGTKYSFGTTEVFTNKYNSDLPSNYDLSAIVGISIFHYGSLGETSSWYLDSITSPNGDKIEFTYTRGESLSLISESHKIYTPDVNTYAYWPSSDVSPPIMGHYYHDLSRQDIFDVILQKITFKNGYIDFETSNRDDIEKSTGAGAPTPQKLSKIKVHDSSGKVIKDINLSHSYFITHDYAGNPTTAYHGKRLKLDAIQIDELDNKYTFDYKNPDGLPDKYSKQYDQYGFYSTLFSSSGNVLDFPKERSDYIGNDVTTGVLKSITYPTKGKTEFEYEPHNLKGVLNNEILNLSYSATLNYLDLGNIPDDYIENPIQTFVITDGFPSTKSVSLKYDSNLNDTNNVAFLRNSDGLALKTLNSGNEETINLPAGTYTLEVRNIPIGYYGNLTASFTNFVPVLQEGGGKGNGMRIKNIIEKDFNDSIVGLKHFIYTVDGFNSGLSSGLLLARPKFEYNKAINLYSGVSVSSAVYNVKSSNSLVPLGFHSPPNVVGYDKVTVQEGINNKISSTTYEYYNKEFDYFEYLGYDEDFPELPNRFDTRNGQLLSVTTKNSQGNIVKKTVNNYELKSQNSVKGVKFYKTPFQTGEEFLYEDDIIRYYDNLSEWWVTSSVNETIYNPNGDNPISTTTTYKYDNPAHKNLTEIQTTNSKGEQVVTINQYPSDHPTGTGMTTSVYDSMISKNILNPVIKQETKVNTNLLSTQVSTYKNWGLDINHDGIPDDVFLPEFVKTAKGSNSLENRIQYLSYYPDGNVKEVAQKDGTSTVYLWGYNNQYPVAKIENATIAQAQALITQSILDSPSDENSLRTELQKIRTGLPNAMVTTYTYAPLIGITSVSDPKGNTTYYNYDSFGRLQNVKDKDGNILSENEYHYKN